MNDSEFNEHAVKAACNGMLPASVYRKMYEVAKSSPVPVILEVGTAHAAGTVSLALGLRDSDRAGKVYTFEKIFGGSREAFGGVDENVEIIKRNISQFGVSDMVELVVGDVAETAGAVPRDTELGLLCIDADGAIDRDFALFFDRLAEGAPLVIDDIRDTTRVKVMGFKGLGLAVAIDQKHRLGYRLLSVFKRHGLVDEGELCGSDTWFGCKGHGKFDDVPAVEVLEVYRSLTFSDAMVSGVPLRARLAAMARRTLPESVIRGLRRIESGER